MEKTGSVSRIADAVINIDFGRKGFAIRGKAEEGRISFEDGIAEALSVFKEVRVLADTHALILIEWTFILQELQLCPLSDKEALGSLTQAKQDFDDAFLALEIVENSTLYKEADKLFPHRNQFRIKGFPKDAFHIACGSHKTRLQNILRSPVDPIEKSLLKQRIANLATARSGYIEKQKNMLGF